MPALAIVYRSTDNDKWGPGKDAKLTIAEGDGNLWEFSQAITDLQDNPPTAVSIANINVVGTAMQIQLTDGSSLGPFTLPVAGLRYRPAGYVVGATYNELDLVPVTGLGLYMVLKTHVAGATFNPALYVDGSPAYSLVFGEDTTVYDVGFSFPGKPGQGIDDGDPICQHIFGRPAYVTADGGANSVAKLGTAPDDDLVLSICKNGAEVGTLTFSATETVGVVVWADDVQWVKDDLIQLMKPDDLDATAKNIVVTFVLVRGTNPAV